MLEEEEEVVVGELQGTGEKELVRKKEEQEKEGERKGYFRNHGTH